MPIGESPEEQEWLETQRSRIRAVQGGAVAWTTVDLIDIEEREGPLLRAMLECYGARVNYYPVGQARHLTAALREAAAPFLILACHGDNGAVILPSLGEPLCRFQPFPENLGPAEVSRHARLRDQVVIVTGCGTGTEAMAAAFRSVGATAYLAPTSSPMGYAPVFALAYLFYELTEERGLAEAVAKLQSHDRELAQWRLWGDVCP